MTPNDDTASRRPSQSGSSFYYSFLFLPGAAARDHGALRVSAAKSTTSSTRCSDAGVARTKLAWWRKEVASVYHGQPQHPVARALAEVVGPYELEEARLQEVIDGMAMDLEYNALSRLRGAESLLPPRRRRRRHPVGEDLRLPRTRRRSTTRRTSASRSSSPTSFATSAKTRGATASTCRCTSSPNTA